MKITFYGQLTCLIEAAGMRIVTDPYLSNSVDSELGKRKYPVPITLNEIMPDIIAISHDHLDHLDPDTLVPFYRMRRRSFTLVPEPSADKIRGLGGDPVGMKAPSPAVLGDSFVLGDVKITALACAHTELHTDENGNYRELSYVIEAEGKRVFFGGDMTMYEGLLETLVELSPDVMIMPVNGRDWFRTSRNLIGNIDSNEAAELAVRAKTKMFIPGHYDMYDKNCCPVQWIRDSAARFGAPLCLLNAGESVEI